MCTVTFLPIGKTDFILTSNRDEKTVRKAAEHPSIYRVYDSLVVYPRDQQAEGTWIATNGIPFSLCLLNGAFENHRQKPAYKKSRGLMLLDFFCYNAVDAFLNNYDFTGIEPFTLLLLDTRTEQPQLTEARWDGEKIHRKQVNTNQPHIWSSATLYNKETIQQREHWFNDFLSQHPDYNSQSILDFHHFGGKDDKNSLVMNRDNVVRTVSITSILKKNDSTYMTYKDVISQKISDRRIC